jgi:hypothetical protein
MKLKIVLILLLLAGNAAIAQSIDANTTDPATGARYITTKNYKGTKAEPSDNVVKRGLVLFSAGYQSVLSSGKQVQTYFIDLNIIHNDNRLGCLQELKSKIILTLEDGTTVECFQISESDCDKISYTASFALMAEGESFTKMAENFRKLMTTKITDMKVITTEGELVYKIKTDSQPYVKSHFALLDKTINATVK